MSTLDPSRLELIKVGEWWRHIDRERKLLTKGWGIREGAERNAAYYRDDEGTRKRMRERYDLYVKGNDIPADLF